MTRRANRDPRTAVLVVRHGPDGQPGVRVVEDQNERVVPVSTGIVADGWVEITSGLNGSELVRLPR